MLNQVAISEDPEDKFDGVLFTDGKHPLAINKFAPYGFTAG